MSMPRDDGDQGNEDRAQPPNEMDATELETELNPTEVEYEEETVLETENGNDANAAIAAGDHPESVGHFRIESVLGQGGMGAVYLAHQNEPVARQVALKVVQTSLRNPLALAQFTAERQAMARLSHPNIAALYEAGATEEGFPYFAMEYIQGKTLTQYCNDKAHGLESRIRLFTEVCEGVQHAHQKGLIHRDLKPGNLLVADVEGRAAVKIIDFGIAKALDEPLTESAELSGIRTIGTPAYMSPEARAGSEDLDTRTDVYSLGIVLYELLVGLRPHQATGAPVTRFQANSTAAPIKRPSTRVSELDQTSGHKVSADRGLTVSRLARSLSGDLDWIVMRAVADEPDERYATAMDLADDLRRYLANEPVEARPANTRYVLGKFVRRHRVAVTGAALVALSLILGIVGTSLGLVRAQQAESEALAQADRADREASAARQVADFLIGLFEVSDPGEARGNSITARQLLDAGAARIRRELVDQPQLRARMMGTIGDVYAKLGLYAPAVELEEEALDLRESEFGDDHIEVAANLNSLGRVYRLLARDEEAELVHRRELAIRESQLGQHHPDVADSLSALAKVLWNRGSSDEAESLMRRALAIRETALGPDSLESADSTWELARLLEQQERYEEGERLLRRTLRIRRAQLGEDHYQVADALAELGRMSALGGRFEEAEELLRQAITVTEVVLPPEHPKRAERHVTLGMLYKFQERYDAAVDTLRFAIELYESVLNTDHAQLAGVYDELGLALAARGDWQEAADAFNRTVTLYETAMGSEHRFVGQALNNYGWALSDGLQRYGEAEKVLRRAVEILSAVEDPDDYWKMLSRWSLANVLRDRSKYVEAEVLYKDLVVTLERTGGSRRPDNPDLAALIADYVKMLERDGRESEARELAESAG